MTEEKIHIPNTQDKHSASPASKLTFTKHMALVGLGAMICFCYLIYAATDTVPAESVIKFMIIYGVVFAMLVVGWFLLNGLTFSRKLILTVLAFTLGFGVILISSPPHQSDDIYRYLWDGKVQSYDISPYSYAPDDPVLGDYHSELLPKMVNFPHIKTIYPPAAQFVFYLSYSLFGESTTGLKFFFLLALLASVWLFYVISKTRKCDPRLLIFFAWNPLIVMETLIDGHLDILMVFFLLLFVRFFFKHSWILAGIALAMAVLTKLIPIILVPLVLFYFILPSATRGAFLKSRPPGPPEKLFNGALLRFLSGFVITVGIWYWWYWESAQNMFLTALNYGSKWYFNNPVFMLILAIVKDNQTAHAVSFSLFLLIYLVILLRPMPMETKFFYTFLAFTFLNPALHPWYLTVLLALLCIYRSHWVMLWSGTIIASYIVVYRFKLTGIWQDSWLLMAIEYLPLVVLTLYLNHRGHKEHREKS